MTWYVKYTCFVNGQQAGCQLVNYVYQYTNQANGNPNWQPVPGTPRVVVDAGLFAPTRSAERARNCRPCANFGLPGYHADRARPRRKS